MGVRRGLVGFGARMPFKPAERDRIVRGLLLRTGSPWFAFRVGCWVEVASPGDAAVDVVLMRDTGPSTAAREPKAHLSKNPAKSLKVVARFQPCGGIRYMRDQGWRRKGP